MNVAAAGHERVEDGERLPLVGRPAEDVAAEAEGDVQVWGEAGHARVPTRQTGLDGPGAFAPGAVRGPSGHVAAIAPVLRPRDRGRPGHRRRRRSRRARPGGGRVPRPAHPPLVGLRRRAPAGPPRGLLRLGDRQELRPHAPHRQGEGAEVLHRRLHLRVREGHQGGRSLPARLQQEEALRRAGRALPPLRRPGLRPRPQPLHHRLRRHHRPAGGGDAARTPASWSAAASAPASATSG